MNWPNTHLTHRLHIAYPIIQAPMAAGVTTPAAGGSRIQCRRFGFLGRRLYAAGGTARGHRWNSRPHPASLCRQSVHSASGDGRSQIALRMPIRYSRLFAQN